MPHEKDTLATPGKDGGAGGGGGEEVETRREAFAGNSSEGERRRRPPAGFRAHVRDRAQVSVEGHAHGRAVRRERGERDARARDDAALDRMSIDRVRAPGGHLREKHVPFPRLAPEITRGAPDVRTNARGGTRGERARAGAAYLAQSARDAQGHERGVRVEPARAQHAHDQMRPGLCRERVVARGWDARRVR